MIYLTSSQMSKVDDLAMNKYNIKLEKMMELAGSNLASLAKKISKGKQILVLVGKGNNGGGGLVAARYLADSDYKVSVLLAQKNRLKKSVEDNLKIIRKMKIPIYYDKQIENLTSKTDLILDCLFGYNLKGDLRKPYSDIIKIINESNKTVISLDIPSGLDATTGIGKSIKAKYTMALALPKRGLKKNKNVGELYLADIGIPASLYTEMKIKYNNPFNGKKLVKLTI